VKNFSVGLTGRLSSPARQPRERSSSSAELDDSPPVALRRPALRKGFELPHGSALVGELLAQFPARVRFAIEGLRHRRGTARFAYKQDLNLEIATFIRDLQHVADVNVACRLGDLSIRFDPAQLTGSLRERTCLEKSRRPEPGIDAYAIHKRFEPGRRGKPAWVPEGS
jgi:hypothetical protein